MSGIWCAAMACGLLAMVLTYAQKERAGIVRYTIIDFGPGSEAVRLNARGDVAFNRRTQMVYQPFRAFLFSDGVTVEINAPADASCRANDLNDAGQVVGILFPSFPPDKGPSLDSWRGFLFEKSSFRILEANDTWPVTLREARLVGNDGCLVGLRADDGCQVLVSGNTVTPLVAPQDFIRDDRDAIFHPSRIGLRQEVLGFALQRNGAHRVNAYTFLEGKFSPPYFSGSPLDINSLGQVVGCARKSISGSVEETEAVFFDGQRVRRLGVPGGFESSSAWAISDSGVIVGTAETTTYRGLFKRETDSRAYVYRKGRWRDLNKLVALSGSAFTRLTTAIDVNEQGQIIGQGYGPGGHRAYLLTPLPNVKK